MNEAIKIDLADMLDAVEHLSKQLPGMAMKAKVDVAARIKAIAKTIEAMDKSIKEDIKSKLGEKDGEVVGEIFKAKLAYNPVTRFDTKAFKEEKPKVYDAFCNTNDEGRVTFEVR